MTTVEPGASSTPSFVSRAIGMLTAPSVEWQRADDEPATVQGLLLGYVAPLAAIPVIAQLIGSLVFGAGIPGIAVVKPSLLGAGASAVIYFFAMLGMTLLMSVVINAFAPNFGGTRDAAGGQAQAMKVAAYSGTAAWVFGAAQIFPMLGIVGLVGLIWSIFLLNGGLVRVMKAAADKAFGYTAAVVGVMFVAWIVAGVVIGAVTAPLTLALSGGPQFGVSAPAGGSVTIGGSEIDLDQLSKAAEEMEAAAKRMEAAGSESGASLGAVAPMDVAQLEALLPASLPGGFAQTEISTGSSGAFGLGAGGATGAYANGDQTIRLTIGDMGGMGAFAGMAGAFGAQSSTRNADGYEKVGTVDGRMTMEKLSKSANTAEYAVIVANRFVLSAEGQNVGMEPVKAAVNAVGVGKLEALAKGG